MTKSTVAHQEDPTGRTQVQAGPQHMLQLFIYVN